MQITRFHVKGYRSLEDVELSDLGPFNIFYGPNGSGKSNILNALSTFVELARVLRAGSSAPAYDRDAGDRAVGDQAIVRRDDLCAFSNGIVEMSATIAPISIGSTELARIELDLKLDWVAIRSPRLKWTRAQATETNNNVINLFTPRVADEHFAGLLEQTIWAFPERVFSLVDSDRFPHKEKRENGGKLEDHLREGELQQALFIAQTHPDAAIRARFRALRELLMGPPLKRPSFDVVQDPQTREVQIRELLDAKEARDVPLELAGLGIAQIYSILANVMLRGTRAVGIEEPEAHLHARTTGLALRQLLVRLVTEGHIDQLFIATHSNLFDLDEKRYFDVKLENGRTVVRSKSLDQIDRDHLYEPGPAKHALKRSLEYLPENETVFRRPDGTAVTASEMLRLLQVDDEAAVRFLEDIHGAAVGAVRVKAKHRNE